MATDQIQPHKQLHVVYHLEADTVPEAAIMNTAVETAVEKVNKVYMIYYNNSLNIIIGWSNQGFRLFQAFGKISNSNEANARYIWSM